MKILLSYSYFHFNPDPLKDKLNKFRNTSAATNARMLYSVLQSFGDVEYIDFKDWEKVKGKEYDLFVGINHNFDNILKYCKINKSVYYAVNQHPIERNKIIHNFIKHKNLSNFLFDFPLFILGFFKKSWRRAYKNELAPMVYSISNADAIICIGNEIVKESYIKQGCLEENIYMLNYDLLRGEASFKQSFHHPVRILYVGSELCLRKGADILYELFMRLSKDNLDYELSIVGDDRYPQYKYLIKKLVNKSQGKVTYYGSLFGEEYESILKKSDFYIFPSIEEGQAGTVLDAMYNGLIPIITKESGVNFSPLGFLEPRLHSDKNYSILKSIFNLTDEQKMDLSKQTASYYNKHHLYFENRLHAIFTQIIGKK